jgi:hypothetical protein
VSSADRGSRMRAKLSAGVGYAPLALTGVTALGGVDVGDVREFRPSPR